MVWVTGMMVVAFMKKGLTSFSPAAKIVVPNPLLVRDWTIEKLMGNIGPGTRQRQT